MVIVYEQMAVLFGMGNEGGESEVVAFFQPRLKTWGEGQPENTVG